jgi:hypothetical protein
MQVKAQKDFQYSLDGINPTSFKAGKDYDIKKNVAESLIEAKYVVAKKVKTAPAPKK